MYGELKIYISAVPMEVSAGSTCGACVRTTVPQIKSGLDVTSDDTKGAADGGRHLTNDLTIEGLWKRVTSILARRSFVLHDSICL